MFEVLCFENTAGSRFDEEAFAVPGIPDCLDGTCRGTGQTEADRGSPNSFPKKR